MHELKDAKTNPLKKVLGLAFGLAVITGSTIGVGILRTPGSIASLLPNATLIISCWIAIGIYIALSASSYAELTTMMPKAGGAYNYIKRAFGNYAGFVTGWFDFLCNAIAPAYFCIVLSEYSAMVFPTVRNSQSVVALGFLTIFTLLNLPGVKSGSAIQKFTSALKIILFIILIAGCFLYNPSREKQVISDQLISGGIWIGLFKSLQLIMGTYDGWMSVSFFAEEDHDPARNIPRSYLFGAVSIAILYILINAAILYVLPVEAIAKSPLAASDAAAVAFGKWSGTLMTAVAIFSLVSILNAYMMIPSRILFGLGRDGFFFRASTVVNKGGTPYYALLICYVFAFILILISSFEQLFGLAVVMMTFVTGFAFASLIWLRYKEPDMPRPYKAFGYPFTTWLALLVTILLFIGFAISDVLSFAIVAILVIISFIVYKLFLRNRHTAEI
ncbi:MAG TPA: APC family permease [Flavobacterium sp.]|jgi:APA family basic amino acid/polyamine antiporter